MGENSLQLPAGDWKGVERALQQQMKIVETFSVNVERLQQQMKFAEAFQVDPSIAKMLQQALDPSTRKLLQQSVDPLMQRVLQQTQQVMKDSIVGWAGFTPSTFAPERPQTPQIIIRSTRHYREIVGELSELPDRERMDALQEFTAAEVERLPAEQRQTFLTELYRRLAPDAEKLESGLSVVRYEMHHHHYYGEQTTPLFVRQINTGGGAYIGGPVTVSGGNLVGRDQVNYGSPPPLALGATSLSQRLASVLSGDNFSLADLKDISEVVGVSWSDLKGKKAADKAKALVEKCEELETLDRLKKTVSLVRPELKQQLQ